MRFYKRKVKRYAAGETVFSENSPCDGMYIVDKGKVRVFKTAVNNGKATEIELCVLGPRAMFGEMAMIDEQSRSASVQAIEPTECTIITKQIFEDQLTRIPTWMVNLIRILVRRLRDTNEALRNHIQNDTKPAPNEDDGDVLTIQSGEADAAQKTTEAERSAIIRKKAQGGLKPEEIIEDLFEE